MFEQLSERLSQTFKQIRGLSQFTESNIEPTLKEVRSALLEADVALPVVKTFIEKIKTEALGQTVDKLLNPSQSLLKLIQNELVSTMGDTRAELKFNTQPPATFLLAGLQGSGKTTTTAKLALHIKTVLNKKVMLVSVDIYRPAAIEQLHQLANKLELPFVEVLPNEQPVDIVKRAMDVAKKQYVDVLLIDTAGRLHVDEAMMTEIRALQKAADPIETLFVVDSMTGQDAAHTAKAFHDALPLTGVILTKTDGDARGGAALSVKTLTGAPIKFVGTGEQIEALEPFYPDRMASRILGMGDVMTLIEDIERNADKKVQENLTNKLKTGKGFDLNDFKAQLQQMNQLGGLQGMMNKLPGMGALAAQKLPVQMGEAITKKTIAMIDSMTPKERRHPKLIIGSRKKRIALGSGTQIQDVNRLLKQFEQMQKMMQKFMKPGAMKGLMRGLSGMKLPPGLMGFDGNKK